MWGMYRTHVKIYKKKFNEIKDFEKTPKMSVGINGVETKRMKFSLPSSASEKEVVGDEEYEDAKATWDDDEAQDPRALKQGEHYPLVEIVEPHEKRITREHRTVSFKNNWAFGEGEPRDWIKEIQDEMNSLGWRGGLLWVQPDFVARNPCSEKIILEIGDLMIQFVFE